MFNTSHGEVIIVKGYKICDLYILEGFNVVHSSSVGENFHDKNKPLDLRSMHGGWLKVVSENFNEYY